MLVSATTSCTFLICSITVASECLRNYLKRDGAHVAYLHRDSHLSMCLYASKTHVDRRTTAISPHSTPAACNRETGSCNTAGDKKNVTMG